MSTTSPPSEAIGSTTGYCERLPVDPGDRLVIGYEVATTYDRARRDDCRTAGLLAELDQQQTFAWWDYLIGYTIALAGCPLPLGPIPGGILVFGPANTAAVGIARPQLGTDDVALLVQQFLEPFARALDLSSSERTEVEAQLWSVAEPDRSPGATTLLSRCPAGPAP